MKIFARWSLFGAVAATGFAAAPPPKEEEGLFSTDDVYEVGKNLFEELAPPEIKEQFEFPDQARWNDTIRRFQAALAGTDPKALVPFEEDVRGALTVLRKLPGTDEYVDWLAERLDYIEAAKQMPRTP